MSTVGIGIGSDQDGYFELAGDGTGRAGVIRMLVRNDDSLDAFPGYFQGVQAGINALHTDAGIHNNGSLAAAHQYSITLAATGKY